MLDKTKASEFDFVILLDASGSMGAPSVRVKNKTRWTEAQETIFGLASAVDEFDDDGLDVIVFGGNVEVHNGVHADDVSKVFSSRGPRGGTPLAEALAEAVKLHDAKGKNMVAMVFTDGEPNDHDAVVSVITAAAAKLDRDEQLTFLFVQIGDDPGATAFLKHLDDNLNAKFDIVDTVSVPEADSMEPIDLINKAIND